MRHFLSIWFLFAISQFGIANDTVAVKQKIQTNQEYVEKISALENKIKDYENRLLSETIRSYQQTNDRINNYLTFTAIIATIFGVIIAVGGVFIGFESMQSRKRRNEAIKTLEEAKSYVEDKKSDFDETITEKLVELNNEYQKMLTFSKERLLEDVNTETQNVKEIAQKKSQEIEDYSIDEKTDEKMESLQKRIRFFENIGIPEDPKILISKAKLLSKKGTHLDAIELLKKLIDLEPENSDAHWRLGWENSKIGHHEESIKYYEKSIELNPRNSSTHNNLAVQFKNTNRPLDALEEYEKAIKLNNKKKLYHNNKIRVLKKLNRNDEALESYDNLLKIDKEDPEIYREIIKFLESQNKLEKTLKYFNLAINEVRENEQEFNFSKAVVLKKIKKYDEAIKGFQNSIYDDYKTDLSYLQIADIKFQQKQKIEAIKILDSAINLNPKNAILYAVKANYEIADNEESAKNTILSGAEKIEGETYFQSMGRYLAKRGNINFAVKLYQKANDIISPKLSEKKESDLMNYYEGLVITGKFDEAEKFIMDNEPSINKDKYKIVKSFIGICSKLAQNKTVDVKKHVKHFEKYANKESFKKVDWVFEDILYVIKQSVKEKDFQVLYASAELLKGQVELDEFKSKIK